MLVEFQLSLFSEGLNVVELFCPFVTCRLTHLSVFLVKTNTFECCSPVTNNVSIAIGSGYWRHVWFGLVFGLAASESILAPTSTKGLSIRLVHQACPSGLSFWNCLFWVVAVQFRFLMLEAEWQNWPNFLVLALQDG